MRLALTLVALGGFAAGGLAGRAFEPLLVWAALWAAPAGALSVAGGRRGWLALSGAPLAVLLAAPSPAAAEALSAAPLLVLVGLFLTGRGAGWLASGAVARRRASPARETHARAVTCAAGLLLLATLLVALPVRGGLGEAPWPPPVAARLLDVSPATLVLEAARVDWLRRPAIYGPAGGDAIGPTLRSPWRPALAAAVALVVGCCTLGLGAAASARPID